MKVLMTGGGTGGHLYPALAVAEALKKQQNGCEILFLGSTHGIESQEVPEAGFNFQGLETIGFPRRLSGKSFLAVWSFLRAILRARAILREFHPHVVFSTGGYPSAPVVVAARWERVPLVLHEQNSVPGLTNRTASRMASEVHLAFASARQFFPRRGHLRLSGNPLREQVTTGSRQRALRLFRLEDRGRTILVFGGSQGAHSINEAIKGALPRFQGRTDLQFLIQSGTADYEDLLSRCREVQLRTWVRRFIANMGDAYALADLVVCRAGAMTISELAACGLPSILIPYPHATRNHQWLNAEQMREAGAAVLVSDAELTGQGLAESIDELLSNPRRLREMSINALRMARPEAADKIARALLKFRPASEAPVESEVQRPRTYGRGRSRGVPGRGGERNGSVAAGRPEGGRRDARGGEGRRRGPRTGERTGRPPSGRPRPPSRAQNGGETR